MSLGNSLLIEFSNCRRMPLATVRIQVRGLWLERPRGCSAVHAWRQKAKVDGLGLAISAIALGRALIWPRGTFDGVTNAVIARQFGSGIAKMPSTDSLLPEAVRRSPGVCPLPFVACQA